ncbi:MAG: hypothetical protein CBC25_00685 [Pelagibacteraceae bacterium TMED65]|nr:MAG: hypothetical protein CBC25_00685 [Pelagibacteraceae bacterium TMED65]|tara:strand:- start:9491 stop:11236 length:1746 start_codon:yes stop_codon:yes gene_type:complete
MLNNFYEITDNKDRLNLYILFILLLLGTLVEMIGIGSIPIFAIAIVEPERILQNLPNFVNFDFINNVNNKQLTFYVSILILVIFLFKNIYIGFVNFFSGYVVKIIRTKTYNNMFNSYIKCNYEFHITKNSADLVRHITSDVGRAVTYIISYINLIKEFLIIITILATLIIVDYKISLLIFLLLGLFSVGFFFLSRKGSKLRGEQIQRYWSKQIKTVNQGLGSIKLTKILGKEKFILNIFKNNIEQIEKYNFIQGFIITLPRLFLELMAILVIVIISISFILTERPFEEFIPLIALIAAASIRLIPSFSTISSSIATMKHNVPSYNLIVSELKKMKELIFKGRKDASAKFKDNLIFNKNIRIKNLTYYYPETKKKIINDVSFQIDHKDIIGIVGSSGAGKSTLIDLVCGLLKPSSGQILVDDIDINKTENNWQKQIGYVPQDIYLLDDTIKSNVAFGELPENFNEENFKNAIKFAQLENFINTLPNKDKTIVGDRGIRLSGGQRQRIGIARSLYFKPNILIFDEPTSSLDTENESKIMNDLYKLSNNITIIIISHRLSVFQKCKKIFKVKDGKVFSVEENNL